MGYMAFKVSFHVYLNFNTARERSEMINYGLRFSVFVKNKYKFFGFQLNFKIRFSVLNVAPVYIKDVD